MANNPGVKALVFLFLLLIVDSCTAKLSIIPGANGPVQLHVKNNIVVMDNGLVEVTFASPSGLLTGLKYVSLDNLLEFRNDDENRGYWDLYATRPGGKGSQHVYKIKGTEFKIITQNEKQVEISFSKPYDSSLGASEPPLNIDKRFVMLQGEHGFYTYAIYEHLKGWPDFNLNGTRVAFKLDKEKFRYMAVSDTRQRRMPQPEDRLKPRGEELQFKEAVKLIDPVDPTMKGQVDDKYMYVRHYDEIKVHGWVSSDPLVGFWQITPSAEFRSAGPLKQDLTSHVGPTSLTVFHSSHYMGQDLVAQFKDGEPWKKVFGPVFIYLNSGPAGAKEETLWTEANKQLETQAQNWPYSFPASADFPKAHERGAVQGKLLVRERTQFPKGDVPAKDAYVGLALPGEVGSWQLDCKGYQFWTKAGPDGSFSIKNVRPGEYNLYAYVPGFISDYKNDKLVTIKAGDNIDLGELTYEPPRNGATLWEIGIPDRSAEEFYIPDVNPNYVNPLYLKQDRYRQYGLWERYTDLYPKNDIVYTVGSSDYTKDWFYAQVTRKIGETFNSTTWQVKFNLDDVEPNANYTLRLAIASSTGAEVQVRFNDDTTVIPHFTTGSLYKDNAIARHTIHGLYLLFQIDVKSIWLKKGENTLFLKQARSGGPFQGVMYDYLRLEGPPAQEPKAGPRPIQLPVTNDGQAKDGAAPVQKPGPKDGAAPVHKPGPKDGAAPVHKPGPKDGPAPVEKPGPTPTQEPVHGPESEAGSPPLPESGPEPAAAPESAPQVVPTSEPEPPTSNTSTDAQAAPPPATKSHSWKLIYSWPLSVLCLVMFFVN